jgi:TonB family protein
MGQWRALAVAGRARRWQDVWVSDEIDIPVVCGVARPRVVVPAEAQAWPRERLDVVLRHEREHVARRDPFVRLLASVVRGLYWPLVWIEWAARRLDIEAELACDDAVLRGGPRASDYADHLVAIVRNLRDRGPQPQAGLPMIRVSELEQRLRAMLRANVNRAPAARRATLGLLLAGMALLGPLAAARVPVEEQRARTPVAALPTNVQEPRGTEQPRAEREPARMPAATPPPVVTRTPAPTPALEQAQPATQPATPRRISVGGNVQTAMLLREVQPDYPPECRAAGIDGRVRFKVTIGRDGDVMNLEQVNPNVDERLAKAAAAAVQQWKYRQTLLNGEPVEVVTTVDVNFLANR